MSLWIFFNQLLKIYSNLIFFVKRENRRNQGKRIAFSKKHVSKDTTNKAHKTLYNLCQMISKNVPKHRRLKLILEISKMLLRFSMSDLNKLRTITRCLHRYKALDRKKQD